jgi:hypothetical protein
MAHEPASHSTATPSFDMADHRSTYEGFLRGSTALALACAYILVALCMFAFGSGAAVFWGFAGLILGLAVITIDTVSGSRTWMLSIGLLVLFGLFTAMRVS